MGLHRRLDIGYSSSTEVFDNLGLMFLWTEVTNHNPHTANMVMDEIILYDRPLSTSDVLDVYNRYMP